MENLIEKNVPLFFVGRKVIEWKNLLLEIPFSEDIIKEREDGTKYIEVNNLILGKTIGFLPVYVKIDDATIDNYPLEMLFVLTKENNNEENNIEENNIEENNIEENNIEENNNEENNNEEK